MDFDWSKYKLTTKLKFDSPEEFMLILPERKRLLITYKSCIKVYDIKTLKMEAELKFDNIEKIRNLYLLESGLISICTKNCIFLIELNKDNTYEIIQKIEFPEMAEEQDFKYVIELKNSNLCIISNSRIFIYELCDNKKSYRNLFFLEEDYIQYAAEKGSNESVIELIYPEKNIENKIVAYLSNVALLSFWDLNTRKKINDTKNNYCNTFDCKDMFCLMQNGKYLLCACIDEAIMFYSTETCEHIKTLYDNYWHISVLKLSENQILSGGDFGRITFYEFDFESDEFKNEKRYLDFESTEKVEKKVNIILPEESKDDEEDQENYDAHGKAINEIRKFGNKIISSSCYEKDNQSYVCLWNKE